LGAAAPHGHELGEDRQRDLGRGHRADVEARGSVDARKRLGRMAEGRQALIPYVTAGDPFADATPEIMLAMAAAGADDFSIVVDPVAFGVPDYWAYVHRPMDLGTVRANVVKGAYSAPWQVAEVCVCVNFCG
jgi:hypothetical protein